VLKVCKGVGYPLHQIAATRQIEQLAASHLPAGTLMQRAGLAVAQLAMALTPHSQRIWVACGPGNNGGDGLEAALHLKAWGKQPWVTWLGRPDRVPAETLAAYLRFQQAGLCIESEPGEGFDLCIDALLGIGTQVREPNTQMADWIDRLNSGSSPVLSVDVPSGLNADTGQVTAWHVKASHTLSLLTLKPGLFTAYGRDAAGTLWLDNLGLTTIELSQNSAVAQLLEKSSATARPYGSHKGMFGDVAVLAGAPGMAGAALLAASAALHAGAGRVLVGLLDGDTIGVDTQNPELMFRPMASLDFSTMTVVCGCGGGQAVQTILPRVLSTSAHLVLDADALNAIATDDHLQSLLISRSNRQVTTVLTPHPLEAARLLGIHTQQVQADRLDSAQLLSRRFACTVALKGSGTVIAAPGHVLAINPSGNGKLATAGTGDVLAGMIGAQLARGVPTFEAACQAVYRHGELADHCPDNTPLTASQLAKQIFCF